MSEIDFSRIPGDLLYGQLVENEKHCDKLAEEFDECDYARADSKLEERQFFEERGQALRKKLGIEPGVIIPR